MIGKCFVLCYFLPRFFLSGKARCVRCSTHAKRRIENCHDSSRLGFVYLLRTRLLRHCISIERVKKIFTPSHKFTLFFLVLFFHFLLISAQVVFITANIAFIFNNNDNNNHHHHLDWDNFFGWFSERNT